MRPFFYFCALLLAIISTGTSQSFAQTTPDPGLMGPLAVSKAEYNLGDLAWKAPDFPDSLEVRGSVIYPTDMSAGPFPVIMFLHGRHSTTYETADPSNTDGNWPPPAGWQSIVSYEGYDYIANTMASHGYIVISISCNAINATDAGVADYGMAGRGELMQHHMDLWNTWNTSSTGPFGSLFVGKLDMQNIGTMGHSRGGEGVVYNALYNQSLGSPYGIKAVITLAPVDFNRHVLNNIPLMNVAPYCDGDVAGLSGVHYYDDARYLDSTDEAAKHSVLFLGANHNFFNTVWTPGCYIAGTADDWDDYVDPNDPYCGAAEPGNKRFDSTTQKAAFNAYAAAFYRLYLGHETQFAPILDVDDVIPPASSLVDSSNVYVSYHPAVSDRLDVNRTTTTSCLTTNTMGATVTTAGLVNSLICGGGLGMAGCGISSFSHQQPHRGSASVGGLAQMNMEWDDSTDFYENEIPAAFEDLTQYQNLVFRTSVNFADYTGSAPLDFTVQLMDSAGNMASQAVSDHSFALFAPPGNQFAETPKILFNTVSIPLDSFSGIDIATVRSIRFLYNKVAAGSLLITDLTFSNSACGVTNSTFSDSTGDYYEVLFTNHSSASPEDSLTYLWHFGDTAIGAIDTSSLANPIHFYNGPGTYIVCLYVSIYRKNGFVCQDSICSSVTLNVFTGINNVIGRNITIAPNPAKNYITVNDADKNDVLTLVDMYGRQVFSGRIIQPTIQLPQSLAAGIYSVVIDTGEGRVYRKILIER